jgi:hypothetical protein
VWVRRFSPPSLRRLPRSPVSIENAAQPFQCSESPYRLFASLRDNSTPQAIKQAVDFLIEQLQQGECDY